MEKHKNFISIMGIAVALLIGGIASMQCSSTKELACNCQEQSLDAWTTEFISNMKAGELPVVADKLAEAKSNTLYAQCINAGLKNMTY
jgi:hypothetical protein